MLVIIQHTDGKWYIRNTDTGNLAMLGRGYDTYAQAEEHMTILQYPPTDDDLQDKEYDGKRVKRP